MKETIKIIFVFAIFIALFILTVTAIYLSFDKTTADAYTYVLIGLVVGVGTYLVVQKRKDNK